MQLSLMIHAGYEGVGSIAEKKAFYCLNDWKNQAMIQYDIKTSDNAVGYMF